MSHLLSFNFVYLSLNTVRGSPIAMIGFSFLISLFFFLLNSFDLGKFGEAQKNLVKPENNMLKILSKRKISVPKYY